MANLGREFTCFLRGREKKMNTEIWERLIHGGLLDRAEVPKIDGRIDVRNLHVAEPHAIKKMRTNIADVTFLGGVTSIEDAIWRSIDFSSSQLPGLRFLSCQIDDCVFDHCRMRDLRVWGTKFSNVSFRSADLRGGSLGGVDRDERTSFRNVDFTAADLRDIGCNAAEFVGCNFTHAKLDKVDFQSSTFTDCTFEGELREVLFYRRGFKGEQFPPNEMTRVDLRRAKLRWSQFRGLDLNDVLFPSDEDHIVIKDFPEALDRLLAFFRGRSDLASRCLFGYFESDQKWLGSRQRVGVLSKHDLMEMAGEEGLRTVMKIIEAMPSQKKGG
jgi:uncharacterized protein YjbI with pentapeptide repeats